MRTRRDYATVEPLDEAPDPLGWTGTCYVDEHADGSRSLYWRSRLIDFDMARAEEDPCLLTQEGRLVGTLSYLAPDHAIGRPASTAAGRDVFALGVILYECLAGRRPFPGEDGLVRSLREPPPPLPDTVPAALADVAQIESVR